MKNGPYILVKAPDDYPGKKYRDKYIYEHHLVWWKNNSEIIDAKIYLIHHINDNKHDNNIKNLQKLSKKEHDNLHGKKLKKIHRIKLNCNKCDKVFLKKGNSYRFTVKQGYNKFYCSRKCQHKGLKINI